MKPLRATPLWQVALSAGAGGLMEALCTNGLRVLKETQQVLPAPQPLQEPLKPSLPLGRGIGLYAATTVFANMWCFTVQHLIKETLSPGQPPGFCTQVVAAVLAGASEAVITNPARRVLMGITLEAACANKTVAPQTVMRNLWQQEGPRALTRGAPVAGLRNALTASLFFPLLAAWSAQSPTPIQGLLAGALAATVTTAVCSPVDSVASRMQAQSEEPLPQMLQAMLQQGGPQVFFKGLLPNAARAAVAGGVSFGTMTAVASTLHAWPSLHP